MSRIEGVGKVRRSEGDVTGGEGGGGAIFFYYFYFFWGGEEGIGRVEMEEMEDEMEEEMELSCGETRPFRAEAETAAKAGTCLWSVTFSLILLSTFIPSH